MSNSVFQSPYQCLAFASALHLESLGMIASKTYPAFKKQVKVELKVPVKGTNRQLKDAFREYLQANWSTKLVESCTKLGRL